MTTHTVPPSPSAQTAPTTDHVDPREALAERLVDDVTRALEAFSVYLGVELGLYRALAGLGAATETALAGRAGIAPRYAREWLEQQTAAGYVTCDDPAQPTPRRTYRLPDGHAEVLADPDSPFHTAPAAVMLAGTAAVLPQLLDAYRSGDGVPYAAYGPEIRRGIAAINRPMFLHELAGWFAAIPELHQRLQTAPPARVLDLGAGLGAAAVAVARAYPRATVLGVDLDDASVAEARTAAAEAGVADRVSFTNSDAGQVRAGGPFDLVTIFEALHDMGDPVGALRTARSLLTPGGEVVVADERVADTFPGSAGPVERFQYGWSILHCLPATLAEDPVEATGTILRAPTVQRWAGEAGFTSFEVLPIDNAFWRFYRMRG